MKKILLVLMIICLCFISSTNVFADDTHIFLGANQKDVLQSDEIKQLNEDLNYIQSNYGINFNFIYGYSITDDELIDFASNKLNELASAYNIVLSINEDYYYFAFSDSCKDILDDNIDALWNAFSSGETFYSGIIDCYQKVVSLINSSEYTTNTLIVSGNPLIYDQAKLLNDEEFKEIENNLKSLSNKYNMDIIILLADSLNGMDARNFADDYYDYNNYKNDGILFVLAMNEREWYVSTKGKAIQYLSDNSIDTIVDRIIDDLSSGNYFRAFETYGEQIDKALDYSMNNNGADYKEKNIAVNLGISAAIAAVITLIVGLVLNGQLKSVRTNKFANNYIEHDSFRLTGYSDLFIRKEVSKSLKQSSSSSSGSSSHTSSSGSSHGGHGGRF